MKYACMTLPMKEIQGRNISPPMIDIGGLILSRIVSSNQQRCWLKKVKTA